MPLLDKPNCWLCHSALMPSLESRAALQQPTSVDSAATHVPAQLHSPVWRRRVVLQLVQPIQMPCWAGPLVCATLPSWLLLDTLRCAKRHKLSCRLYPPLSDTGALCCSWAQPLGTLCWMG